MRLVARGRVWGRVAVLLRVQRQANLYHQMRRQQCAFRESPDAVHGALLAHSLWDHLCTGHERGVQGRVHVEGQIRLQRYRAEHTNTDDDGHHHKARGEWEWEWE